MPQTLTKIFHYASANQPLDLTYGLSFVIYDFPLFFQKGMVGITVKLKGV